MDRPELIEPHGSWNRMIDQLAQASEYQGGLLHG